MPSSTRTCLGKSTFSSREKSYRHLVQHYGLDLQQALFRLLRQFAGEEPAAPPADRRDLLLLPGRSAPGEL